MTADEPFISLRNVRKVYRSKGAEFLAVSDVTMDVAEGELVSLVGPSGCGKTTVLKILAGLHEADGGTIRIGNAKTPFDPARDIGMVFQQALLLKWRTILDNVLLPAQLGGQPRAAARARVAARERAVRHRLVAIRYSQVRTEERPSKPASPVQAASRVSWRTSSAPSGPARRRACASSSSPWASIRVAKGGSTARATLADRAT